MVAGPDGSDRPVRFIPMLNAERSPTYYEFSADDLLKLHNEMWDRKEEAVVTYHSHTATEAYPSRTDIAHAEEPNSHYVIVSTRDGADQQAYEGPVEFRSYRILDGVVTEEEVKVVAAYSEPGEN